MCHRLLHMCLGCHVCGCPWRPESGTEVNMLCASWCECWEPNLTPLEELDAPLTAGSSPPHTHTHATVRKPHFLLLPCLENPCNTCPPTAFISWGSLYTTVWEPINSAIFSTYFFHMCFQVFLMLPIRVRFFLVFIWNDICSSGCLLESDLGVASSELLYGSFCLETLSYSFLW